MSQNDNNTVTFFPPKTLPNRRQQPDPFAVGEVAIAGSNSRQERAPPANASAARSAPSEEEDEFSVYIRKVKGKMRSVSGVGAVRRDSFNDRVTHYIDRAKSKMRRTSGVGVADLDGSLE